MFYDRKIKYVHMYEKDEKMQNVGFVKLERMEDKVNIYVRISGLRRTNKEECVIMTKGKGTASVLGNICLEDGKGYLEIKGLAAKQIAEGVPYEDLREIFMDMSAGVKLRCIVQEICEEIREEIPEEISEGVKELTSEDVVDVTLECDVENVEDVSETELLREAFVQEKRMLEENANESTVVVQEEKLEKEPVNIRVRPQIMEAEKPMRMAADKWQQLWALYPHMKPFEDEREYLVVKPIDFVVLQDKYYSLSANSFLLHGYYNYEHLILCREKKRDGEYFYIGVPGNFYEKEKQVAVLFGFESFEGKREPAGNGDFGYYMIPVEI